MATDLVLSSGFLAFGRHAGFLAAVEEAGTDVDGLCGTSSGALVGALWAAGWPAGTVLRELSAGPPALLLRPSARPWRGLLSMRAVVRRLRGLLPKRIEELGRPFGVGVCTLDGRHRLLREGALPEAVAASCAMPGLFAPVPVEGEPYRDGGAADRIGLRAWRAGRPERELLVHLVERTSGREAEDGLDGCRVVRTPRSGARFWRLGDVEGRVREARRLTQAVLGTEAASS